MHQLLLDLRFAVRMFARRPGLAAAALATLALGVGANSAIFSVVDAALLKPPPFRDPARIVVAWTTSAAAMRQSGVAEDKFSVSWGDFYDWQRQTRSFSHLAMFEPDSMGTAGAGTPAVQLAVMRVTGDFAAVFGTPPLLGRTLAPGDDQPGKPAAILLSYAAWRRSFGADPQAIGRRVDLDGDPALVVGVMPRHFTFPRAADMPAGYGFAAEPDAWVPYCLRAAERQDHGHRTGQVVARLRPGVGIAAAAAELRVVWSRLARQYPLFDQGFGVALLPIGEQMMGGLRRPLLVLWAAVGLVLLIACANVANLLLAHATARRQEITVRAALGASRRRLIRQLLAESGLLAAAGSLLGVAVAALGLRALDALAPPNLAGVLDGGLDRRGLGFTLLLAALATVLAGLLPALRTSRSDLTPGLRGGARGGDGGASRRTRDALVVAQLTVSLVLLTGAGLLLRSFARVLSVSPGFHTARTLAFDLELPADHLPTEPRRRFYAQVVDGLQALPGVAAAAAINHPPLTGGIWLSGWAAEGKPLPRPADIVAVDARAVTPRYFAAMGIPLRRGRLLDTADREQRLAVAVVDDGLARALWPGEDPLGKRLRYWDAKGRDDPESPWLTVVGIVGTVHYDGLDVKPRAQLYKPVAQGPHVSPNMTFVLRAAADPAALAAAARAVVHRLAPALPVADLRTLDRVVADSLAPRRFALQLLALFAVLALTLATVGVYGVTWFSVVQRTRELGIRIALGAHPRQILRLLLAAAGAPVALGLALGLAASFAVTRALTAMLYGVAPTDPATYAAAILLLALAAALAIWLPGRRAARLDPMTALRTD